MARAGVNIQIMQPGQPTAATGHVFVGAGSGPCAVLMIGSRRTDVAHCPVNEIAARYCDLDVRERLP